LASPGGVLSVTSGIHQPIRECRLCPGFSFRQLFSCLIVAVISALIACSGHKAASRPPDVQVASVVQEDTLI
jgi:hypothetical protein